MKIKDTNQQQAMITLNILLIAAVLLSMVAASIIVQEISLYKAGKLFIKHIAQFLNYLTQPKKCAIAWLANLIQRFALKESRKNRPSTKFLLNLNLP